MCGILMIPAKRATSAIAEEGMKFQQFRHTNLGDWLCRRLPQFLNEMWRAYDQLFILQLCTRKPQTRDQAEREPAVG